MDFPEFDFVGLGNELRTMAAADALGDLVTANEQLFDAELRLLLAQAGRNTARTAEEEAVAWSNVIGALDDSYTALYNRIEAKGRLKASATDPDLGD